MGEVGVYFSDTSRNRHPAKYVDAYRGLLLLLLQTHEPFQIVTPRTLSGFHGQTLIFPEATNLEPEERRLMQRYAGGAGRLLTTGAVDPGLTGVPQNQRFVDDPGARYVKLAQSNFTTAQPASELAFLNAVRMRDVASVPHVEAGREVVAQFASIEGKPYIFLVNFTGVVSGSKILPDVQHDIQVTVSADKTATMLVLPFLGQEFTIPGVHTGPTATFTLPQLNDGAVLWFE